MSNVNVSQKTLDAAKRYEEMLKNRPVEEQLAVGLISKNVLNGCSWEFVRDNPEIKRCEDEFAKSNVCSLQRVTYNASKGVYGYLIYMQMDHLCNLLGPKMGGPLNERDLAIASKHRQEAQVAFAKKLMNGYEGMVGIFCTNDCQAITVSGVTYPAYAITLKELCIICQKYNYGIELMGRVVAPTDIVKREDAVLKNSVVAPNSNALFISVKKFK